jgi:hypothetical protein
MFTISYFLTGHIRIPAPDSGNLFIFAPDAEDRLGEIEVSVVPHQLSFLSQDGSSRNFSS